MKKTKGFTLLELIVVLAIIGTLIMLVAPSFRISEDSAQSKFAPFVSFIENARNVVIKSGKPMVLELNTTGKIRTHATKKDKKGKYKTVSDMEVEVFSVTSKNGKNEIISIILMPNGTLEPFLIELPSITKKLIFNGTSARGQIL